MVGPSLLVLLRLYLMLLTICSMVLSFPFNDHSTNLETRAACKIEDARLTTTASSPLQPPSNDVKVMHVAIGKGSQNYTCLTNNPLDAPASVGALATLFDASCIASKNPAKLAQLPQDALQTELPKDESKTLTSSKIPVSGHHFFPNPQTPIFELVTAAANLGSVSPTKADSKPAPPNAIVGKDNKGDGAVPWLKLTASGEIKEVYRVNTAGGNPPKTCENMPKNFEVQYAAEYWFFKAKSSDKEIDPLEGNEKDEEKKTPKLELGGINEDDENEDEDQETDPSFGD